LGIIYYIALRMIVDFITAIKAFTILDFRMFCTGHVYRILFYPMNSKCQSRVWVILSFRLYMYNKWLDVVNFYFFVCVQICVQISYYIEQPFHQNSKFLTLLVQISVLKFIPCMDTKLWPHKVDLIVWPIFPDM
jgi:hypothetical protein